MLSICSNRHMGKRVKDNRAESIMEKTKRSTEGEKIMSTVDVTSSEVGVMF